MSDYRLAINALFAARVLSSLSLPAMGISFTLDSPQKWLVFRLAALNRASRLIRRMHLGPTLTLLSYPCTEKSKSQLCAVSRDPGGRGPDDFVVFEVEQTLFRVHMSLFLLKIWSPLDSDESTQPQNITPKPVILSDTAENFRFFLWDLQAFPHELSHLNTGDSDVIHIVNRLLNITEMANKHNLSVLEIQALESLRHFVLSSHFRSVSSAHHCRILRVATSSSLGHQLLEDLSRRLMHHILRCKSPLDGDLLFFAERDPRLQKLQGAIYYRQLIDTERECAQPSDFPPSMDIERRMRFLAAHISLSALCTRTCTSAPLIPSNGCPSHSACLSAWEEVWTSAVVASQPTLLGSADVLGRLRHMIPLLRHMVPAATMEIECGLAALEAAVTLRDDIMESLLDHFIFATGMHEEVKCTT
ncbi:hypothetical protein K438DRAFT_769234 [Mycena galopus ATCC 62051]|nr:hypothetical protein K438DRAFT_769234 [Mycena galopus ATCC 62051]